MMVILVVKFMTLVMPSISKLILTIKFLVLKDEDPVEIVFYNVGNGTNQFLNVVFDFAVHDDFNLDWHCEFTRPRGLLDCSNRKFEELLNVSNYFSGSGH